jgi:hypothetical protein
VSPIQGFLEVVDQPLYDTLYTLAPRDEHRRDRETLFSIPVGQMHDTKTGWRVKTFEDTNLVQSGMLDSANTFEVRNIRCALIGRRLFSCDSRYYRDLWISFQVNRKTMWEGPSWRCVDPTAMMASQAAFAAMAPAERTELVALLRRPLDPPVTIQSQQFFCVTAVFGDAWREAWYNAPDRLVVLLEGRMSRAVV